MKSLLENKKVRTCIIAVLILIVLLLLGLVVNNVNKINKRQDPKLQARERIEQILEMAKAAKQNNENYNSNEYLDDLFRNNNITINGNVVSSNGYNFEIDRENLNISNDLGSTNVDISSEVTGSSGTDANGIDLGKVLLNFTSNIPIDKVLIEKVDGTIEENDVNSNTYSKEIEVVYGYTHIISVVTSDGKISMHKISKVNPYPQISNPSTASGVRTGKTLNFTWQEINEIAKAISNNSSITRNTQEFSLTYKGNDYLVGVGDYTTLNGCKVRIIGFNHDTLTNKNAYGGTNTYAGISFEFVNFIASGAMNGSATNSRGWGGSQARSTLVSKVNSLENKDYIKPVNKLYFATYNSPTRSTISDRLWLLSCSEVWNNGWYNSYPYGCAIGPEGEQYKYYKNANAKAESANANLVKNSTNWWLRSPESKKNTYFCYVQNNGSVYWGNANYSKGFAPGFCI